jgi:hypothetical protein
MYEMTVSKRALNEVNGKLVEDVERLNGLPDKPEQFRPITGSYHRVSMEAVRRNQAQLRSGFLDYIYAPEPVKVPAEKPVEP